MALVIEERISLRAGKEAVLLPKDCMLMHNGERYYKLMTYHISAAKVLALVNGLAKPPNSASMANSQGLASLRKLKTEALAASLVTDADGLFEAEAAEAKVAKARKADMPDTVVVKLGQVDVKILCRGFYSQVADMVVLMDIATITAVFKHLHDDGFDWQDKRTYKRLKPDQDADVQNPEDEQPVAEASAGEEEVDQ